MIASETLARLEFDKLLTEIERHAHSNSSAERIRMTTPLHDAAAIAVVSGRIEEIRALRIMGVSPALGSFDDIRPALELLRPAGVILPPQELLQFIPVLRLYAALSRQFDYREDIPLLKSIAPNLKGFPDILEPLAASIDHDGSIMDSASPLLKETRRAKRGLAGRIRKKIEEIIRSSGIEKFLQDDFITQRNGRWVIPVRMDSKGMVNGVVHDVSSSGETAFMEPLEIIPFVNELENLTAEEKAEEIRILRQLSGWLREDADEIAACFETLISVDALNSMAIFADDYALTSAAINNSGTLRLCGARHPLLLMLQRKSTLKNVEPLDLELTKVTDNNSAAVMVITGPNAGGKTVALKTSGMLLLMALCGLPVPADSHSTFPVIDTLLVDIGDDQSIEQSHSTFSAHAARVTEIIRRSGHRSLVLLDELGAGTEPLQGAAIACGVLHQLQQQGSLVIATTHLSDIIGFVHKTPGMINAGMAFDDTTFTPLYRLTTGEPGQSHAVEIASRFGMPDSVISFARQMLGNAGSEFASLLTELRQRRNDLDTARRALKEKESALHQREVDLQIKAHDVERIRRESAEKAWGDAKELISATRRKMNTLLEELKKDNRNSIIENIRQAEQELTQQLEPRQTLHEQIAADSVVVGCNVHVSSLGCTGTVLSVSAKTGKARIRAGRMEIDILISELSKPRAKNTMERIKPPNINWRSTIEESEQRELKLIGTRVDDALTQLEHFISHSAAASVSEVRIIHGIGTGRLRNAIREELARHPLVESCRAGEAHEGRDGATIVTLRT